MKAWTSKEREEKFCNTGSLLHDLFCAVLLVIVAAGAAYFH